MYTSPEPSAFNLVTNASLVPPPLTVWKAPGVVGKSADFVVPVTYAMPPWTGFPETMCTRSRGVPVMFAFQYVRSSESEPLVSAAAGLRSMIVWVLDNNHHARRFYEAMGGREIGIRSERLGLHRYDQVAYGWHDLTPLVSEPDLR